VFLEGLIFFALTVFGLRQWLARLIPRSIALAIGAGIGLFLTLIGLSSSGLGVVQGATATPLQIGGCLPEFKDEVTGICVSHVLQDPKMWLGIFAGGVVTAFLLLYRVKGEFDVRLASISYCKSDQNSRYNQVPFFGPSSSLPSARGLETPV
jgi:AGZA family xanthine/uracil permease-like MFS transporter